MFIKVALKATNENMILRNKVDLLFTFLA